ncbi:hypothetical protein IE81DRAFT_247388 [Ceraceosorus guamensis]|uniref:Uncharacterized protein n=1 Tax=Ceraceosorus guamensis TaxID=1522189 RepID=A0A316VSF6_9BASI|nr:hypothetical protein IE81DRAFT_247388 [Ceraceosorus guamensis]PWN39988.1 hypothetical protein IE81DRAFT_247388 [Ceraceosorus guamensis]
MRKDYADLIHQMLHQVRRTHRRRYPKHSRVGPFSSLLFSTSKRSAGSHQKRAMEYASAPKKGLASTFRRRRTSCALPRSVSCLLFCAFSYKSHLFASHIALHRRCRTAFIVGGDCVLIT